jgi:hypothetical protein
MDTDKTSFFVALEQSLLAVTHADGLLRRVFRGCSELSPMPAGCQMPRDEARHARQHPFLIHKLILYSSVFICVYLWRHSSRRSAKPEMKTATDARRWTQIKPVFLGPWNNCFSQSRMPPGSSGEFSVAVQAFHGHACVEARSRMRPLRVTELGRLPHGGVSHRGLSGQCVPVGIGVGHLVGAGEDDARSTQMAFAACLGGCYARERF